MGIPSGAGTEVLKRHYIHGNSGAWTALLTGVANHIYKVLSVTACEQTGTAETIYMRVDISASGTAIYLVDETLPAVGTFVWNDKFVMSGTDKLEIYNTAGNVDWYISYIDQDWT